MAEFKDPPVTDQEDTDTNFVWWICLLPGLVAAGIFGYQFLHNRSPLYLGYSVAALVACIVFGTLIVGSKGAQEGADIGGDIAGKDKTG